MNQSEIQEALKGAEENVRSGNSEDAFVLLDSVLTEEPDNREAHLLLGVTYARAGRDSEAEEEFSKVLGRNPSDTEALNNVAIAYRRQGKLQDALGSILEAIDLEPTKAEFYVNIANIQKSLGNLKAALMSCAKVIEMEPNFSPACNILGILYDQMKEYKKAANVFKQGANIAPNDPELRFNCGAAMTAAGRLDEALAEYKAAMEIKPNWVDPLNNAGIIEFIQGRNSEATGIFEKIIAADSFDARAKNNLGVVKTFGGNTDDAIDSFRDAIEINPEYTTALVNLGKALIVSGDITGAIAEYERYLKSTPDNNSIRNRLAALYLKVQRYDKALDEATRVLENDEKDAEALRIKGLVNRRSGNNEEAESAFKTILQNYPESFVFSIDLADVYFHDGKYKEAKDCIAAYVDKKPDDAKAKLLLAAVEDLEQSTDTDDSGTIKRMWEKNISLLVGCTKEPESANTASTFADMDAAAIDKAITESQEFFFCNGPFRFEMAEKTGKAPKIEKVEKAEKVEKVEKIAKVEEKAPPPPVETVKASPVEAPDESFDSSPQDEPSDGTDPDLFETVQGRKKLLGLLRLLRELMTFLPKKEKTAFGKSNERLRLELLIEALEGNTTLFKTIEKKA